MPEHNLLLDLFGALTLPMIIILAFAMIAGVNPGPICGSYMKLIGTLLTEVIKLFFQIATLLLKEVSRYISYRQALTQQQNDMRDPIHSDGNSQRRVRIYED